MSRITLLGCTLVAGLQLAVGQSNNHPMPQEAGSAPKSTTDKPALTKDQQDFFAQLDIFKQGRRAFSDEIAREKAGDCPHAVSTYEVNMCLGKEMETTTANYSAYVRAVRSAQGLKSLGSDAASGPSGKPLSEEELVRDFDEVEIAWQAFHKAQCSAAYDAYKSGTIAPTMSLTYHLELMRNHMRELEDIYQFMH